MTSKTMTAASTLAMLAWLLLLAGLVYARLFVTDAPPNVVITFSDKGLTRLLVELASLVLGSIGIVLVVVALILGARNRALAFAAAGNISVCAVCLALLV